MNKKAIETVDFKAEMKEIKQKRKVLLQKNKEEEQKQRHIDDKLDKIKENWMIKMKEIDKRQAETFPDSHKSVNILDFANEIMTCYKSTYKDYDVLEDPDEFLNYYCPEHGEWFTPSEIYKRNTGRYPPKDTDADRF